MCRHFVVCTAIACLDFDLGYLRDLPAHEYHSSPGNGHRRWVSQDILLKQLDINDWLTGQAFRFPPPLKPTDSMRGVFLCACVCFVVVCLSLSLSRSLPFRVYLLFLFVCCCCCCCLLVVPIILLLLGGVFCLFVCFLLLLFCTVL